MEVKQIYTLMNDVTSEILGETGLVQEDLSNVVDIGVQIFDATSVDNYVKSLVNHIGKVIFVNRPYSGSVPSVFMTAWEFGSVMEKITADLPDATENESWELEDGAIYEQNQFYKPSVSAKFFNSKVTFEIPMSFTELQVKQSFSSAEQLNGFISMLYNAVDKSMTVKIDGLIMRGINNLIAETVHDDFPSAGYSSGSGTKAINLLKLYNDKFTATLTPATAITNAEFIKFASYMMGLYVDRLTRISTLFNVGKKDRFTPKDLLHVVLLSDFQKSADAYLQSSAYHNEYTKLPNAETVPYFQGSGTSYDFADVSKIKVKTASNDVVEVSGIIGVMFDRDAVGVCNQDRRVTTHYNAKAEFYNNWYKADCSLYNDYNEQCIVFFVA